MSELNWVNLPMEQVGWWIDESGKPTPMFVDSSWMPIPFDLLVSQWKVDWYSNIDKFWKNPLIQTWTDPEVVWEYGWMYTYTVNAWADYYFSSSNNSDTQDIQISVLTVDTDWNWNNEVFVQTLVWQTKTLLTPPSWDKIVRIYRAINVGTTDLLWTVYFYEDDTTTTPWVPDTASKVRAIVSWWNNQTLMSVYTIPTGYVWFLIRWELWLEFTWSVWVGTNFATFNYRSRRFGSVFQVKKEWSLINLWTSIYKDKRSFPDIIPAKTDIELVVKEVSADMWVWGTFDILLIEEDKLPESLLTTIWQIKRVN